MNTAPQAEIAAVPASAPETTAATPSPAPAAEAPAETTAPPYFDATALDSLLFDEAAPSAPAPKQEAAVTTTPATTEATPAATETPASTETAPAAEPPAGETPQASEAPTEPVTPATEAPVEPVPEKILPNRITTDQFNAEEQRALALKHKYDRAGTPITVKEAFELLDRQDQQATNAAAIAVQEAESTPDPVSTLEQEVSAIRTKLKEAGEHGTLMTGDIADLQIALADKTADLKIAKLQQEQQQSTRTASTNAVFAASKADAYKAYPAAQERGTKLSLLIPGLLEEWQDPTHENHALLSRPDAPMLVIKAAAEMLGIAPVGTTPPVAPTAPAPAVSPATPTAPAPQPAAGNVTSAPGSRSVGAPAAAPNAQDLLKQSLTDPSVLDKALGYDDSTLMFG